MSLGYTHISGREVRVGINRLLEVVLSFPFFLVSAALTVFVQVVVALKVSIQNSGTYRLCLRGRNSVRLHMRTDLASDLRWRVPSEAQSNTPITLEAVGPNVSDGRPVAA